MIKEHKSYKYAQGVVNGEVSAPKYVIKQCRYFIEICNGKSKTIEVAGDIRPNLLNDDTKDTLNGVQFKRAIVRDYLLFGKAYAYINKKRNNVQLLHYIEAQKVQVNKNFDPIFKDYDLIVHGQTYKPFEFLKITRASPDGINGAGIDNDNDKVFAEFLGQQTRRADL